MSHSLQLLVLKGPPLDGEPLEADVTYTLPLSERALHIGRAPDNDLVLADDMVSWHHATLWQEQGQVWVRDRGSRNGTFLNDTAIRDAARVPDGARIRLGTRAWMMVRGAVSTPPREPEPIYLLEDLAAGVRHRLAPPGLTIGGKDADVPLGPHELGSARLRHDHGKLFLVSASGEFPIAPGVEFGVGGRRFRVLPARHLQVMTADQGSGLNYGLHATLDGAAGPEASLTDPVSGRTHRMQGETRAILLFVLARKCLSDRETGVDDAELGWMSDDDLMVAIWGRDALRSDGNSLHVLLSRVRRELREAGFSPELIEKRRKLTRVVVANMNLR